MFVFFKDRKYITVLFVDGFANIIYAFKIWFPQRFWPVCVLIIWVLRLVAPDGFCRLFCFVRWFLFSCGFALLVRCFFLCGVFFWFCFRPFPSPSPPGPACCPLRLTLCLRLGVWGNLAIPSAMDPTPASPRSGLCSFTSLLVGVGSGTAWTDGWWGDGVLCDHFQDDDHGVVPPGWRKTTLNEIRPFRQRRVLLSLFLCCLQLRCRLKLSALRST